MSARRPHILRKKCAHEGCSESARYSFDTAREYRESSLHKREWRCVRHSSPEKVLSLTNLECVTEMEAKPSADNPGSPNLYWHGGRLTSGFTSGDGYKAFANDFPPGTKLIVIAQIILPTTL